MKDINRGPARPNDHHANASTLAKMDRGESARAKAAQNTARNAEEQAKHQGRTGKRVNVT